MLTGKKFQRARVSIEDKYPVTQEILGTRVIQNRAYEFDMYK